MELGKFGRIEDFYNEYESVPVEPTPKRVSCERCRRPITVCWCPSLPDEPIATHSTVVVLQHPSEEKQCLRTAPILMASLSKGKCYTIKGRKFTPAKNIWGVPDNDSILLYPGSKAIDISDLPPVSKNGKPYTILLIDGTWSQAKSIYHNSPYLQQMRQVKISPSGRSEYVIKTQPSENCLSTVESAALALGILEENPKINELLLRPLQTLCQFQLQHGAVEHRSKEYLITNGVYTKAIPRKFRAIANGSVPTCGSSENGSIPTS